MFTLSEDKSSSFARSFASISFLNCAEPGAYSFARAYLFSVAVPFISRAVFGQMAAWAVPSAPACLFEMTVWHARLAERPSRAMCFSGSVREGERSAARRPLLLTWTRRENGAGADRALLCERTSSIRKSARLHGWTDLMKQMAHIYNSTFVLLWPFLQSVCVIYNVIFTSPPPKKSNGSWKCPVLGHVKCSLARIISN